MASRIAPTVFCWKKPSAGWQFNGYVFPTVGRFTDIYSQHKYVKTIAEGRRSLLETGTDLDCDFSQTENAGYWKP